MKTVIRAALAAFAAVLAGAHGHEIHAGLITVTDHFVQNAVGDYATSTFNSNFYMGTALDGIDHTVTSNFGDNTYSTTANLSEQPLGATINYTFDGSMTATSAFDGAGAISLAVLKFTADGDNLSYALSGNYSYSRLAPFDTFNDYQSHVTASFLVDLRDVTTNTYLFKNYQSDTYAPGAFSYPLGGTVSFNPLFPATLEGSLNGGLINGHVYEFIYSADSRYGAFDAFGNMQLSITSEAQAVPEPASMTLMGLGTLGMGLMVRRRRGNSLLSVRSQPQSPESSAALPTESVA